MPIEQKSEHRNRLIYVHFIYDKGTTTEPWGLNSLFTKWTWGDWMIVLWKKVKLNPLPYIMHKINSR